MKRRAFVRNKSRGFTMTELIVVFAVVLAAIVGAFVLYRPLANRSKLKEEMSFMSNLFIEIQRLYSYQGSYRGLSAKVLIDAGVVPQDRIRGEQIINKFGGTITPQAEGTDYSQFSVKYTNIPKQVCVDMVLASNNIPNLVRVSVNNANALGRGQIDVDAARNSCNKDEDNEITIVAR